MIAPLAGMGAAAMLVVALPGACAVQPSTRAAPSRSVSAVQQQDDSLAVPLTWIRGETLPVARDHHVTFVVGDSASRYLYVAGGNDYRRQLPDVWRAPIREDGTIGPWQPAASLPGVRAGHSVVVVDAAVVLTGGRVEGGG